MIAQLRTNATAVWFVLSALVVVSWAPGTRFGFGDQLVLAAVVIFAVAIFKVRLVGCTSWSYAAA